MKKVALASALAVFVGSFAVAQTPPSPPKPAAEMANLKFFAGTWSCTGDAPASPFGPAHKTLSSLMLKPDLDGFWLAGTMMEQKTASNTQPVKGMLHIGYDSYAKKYVVVWLDNFGTWATEMSSGWEGDTMIFSGDQMMMGEKASAKDTFTKKGPSEFTHKFEMTMKGENHVIVDETCKGRK